MSIYKHISEKVQVDRENTGKIQGILKRIPCGHPAIQKAGQPNVQSFTLQLQSLASGSQGDDQPKVRMCLCVCVCERVIAKAQLPLARLCAMVTMQKGGQPNVQSFTLQLQSLASGSQADDQPKVRMCVRVCVCMLTSDRALMTCVCNQLNDYELCHRRFDQMHLR